MRLFVRRPFTQAPRRRRFVPAAPTSDESTYLIVGLGNPGPEHAGNRHNIGFWCVNELARRSGWSFRRRGRLATIAEGTLCGRHVLLVKPQTFVNRSGDAVGELARRYRLPATQVVVIYDELDLPVGALRIREQGSHGGQNGMRSIIAALGTQEFPRIRVGIGRPFAGGEPTRDPEYVAAYVLSNPPRDERQQLESVVVRVADAIEYLLREGTGGAMAQFNTVGE
jgi:peptidyl-tRNA hydrolase, PTH1 family